MAIRARTTQTIALYRWARCHSATAAAAVIACARHHNSFLSAIEERRAGRGAPCRLLSSVVTPPAFPRRRGPPMISLRRGPGTSGTSITPGHRVLLEERGPSSNAERKQDRRASTARAARGFSVLASGRQAHYLPPLMHPRRHAALAGILETRTKLGLEFSFITAGMASTH